MTSRTLIRCTSCDEPVDVREEPCGMCGGNGKIKRYGSICSECNGTGKTVRQVPCSCGLDQP